jgi:molecular chaperone HscB
MLIVVNQLEKHASSAPSETESLEDPEVLMEVMELREGLEDAASEEEVAEVRERNKGESVLCSYQR